MKHLIKGSWHKTIKSKDDFDLAVSVALGILPFAIQLAKWLDSLGF